MTDIDTLPLPLFDAKPPTHTHSHYPPGFDPGSWDEWDLHWGRPLGTPVR